MSEAGDHPNFRKNALGVEKAILGAQGEFRAILGATLGVQKLIIGMRNPILGMVSHDLSNAKTTILGATLGAIPGIAANPPERFFSCPCILGAIFPRIGVVPARQANFEIENANT